MNRFQQIVSAVALALPLSVFAQAVKGPDQPRSDLEKQQTTQNGQATKYGAPASDATGPAGDPKATPAGTTSKKDKKAGKTDGAAAGSSAPKADGTPTSTDTTK